MMCVAVITAWSVGELLTDRSIGDAMILRTKCMKPTETKGPGEWWWDESVDGIRVCHRDKDDTETALAFFSWAKIRGAVKRKDRALAQKKETERPK